MATDRCSIATSLRKLLIANDSLVFPVAIVDAKDGAKHLYERYGLQAFQDVLSTIKCSIKRIISSF